jgi:hypothetical protein
MMFRLCATSVARVASRPLALASPATQSSSAGVSVLTRFRPLSTVADCATANDALKYSGYSEIDFTISEDANVYDAVQKFAAFNIGCLVTTDAAGKLRFFSLNDLYMFNFSQWYVPSFLSKAT